MAYYERLFGTTLWQEKEQEFSERQFSTKIKLPNFVEVVEHYLAVPEIYSSLLSLIQHWYLAPVIVVDSL